MNTPVRATATPRKDRCRLLALRKTALNRCENESVSDFGLCAHHLAEAWREFEYIASALRPGAENNPTPERKSA